MTARLLDHFSTEAETQYQTRPQANLFEFVVHSLRALAASRGETTGVDVETVYAAIEGLGSRRDLPVYPFVSAWHPFVQDAERTAADIFGGPARRLSQLFDEAVDAYVRRGSSSFEAQRFAEAIVTQGAPEGAAFLSLQDAVLNALARILRIDSADRVGYLGPLVDLYTTQGRLAIATLNYDTTIEKLGQVKGVDIDVGFGAQTLGPGLRLLKLHGSIDWALFSNRPGPDASQLPAETVERLPEGPDASGPPPAMRWMPAVIFGAGNKLKAEGPYLALLRRFEEELDSSAALLVVGYSFRDEHVNAVVTSWVNGDTSRRVVILNPSADRFSEYGVSRTNLGHLLVRNCKDRVSMVSKSTADGLQEAIALASQMSS